MLSNLSDRYTISSSIYTYTLLHSCITLLHLDGYSLAHLHKIDIISMHVEVNCQFMCWVSGPFLRQNIGSKPPEEFINLKNVYMNYNYVKLNMLSFFSSVTQVSQVKLLMLLWCRVKLNLFMISTKEEEILHLSDQSGCLSN